MVEFNINAAASSDMANRVEDYSVSAKNTDGVSTAQETEWINSNWSQQYGYYKTIPELKKAIDMYAIWTVGKGYKAGAEERVILDFINGWGNDSFNTILKNMVITMQIGGDAFAEIIRNDNGRLSNLKPLDPGTIKIVVDNKGVIKRYEQVSKLGDAKKVVQKFEPNEIFHLTKDRIADQIHGTSIIDACEVLILALNESRDDMKKLQHRHVKPIMKFMVDTADPTKIETFAQKMDAIINLGENLYIPKDTVEHEVISISTNETLNPLPWQGALKSAFYQAVGIPEIILGGSAEFTESTAKIAYLAFQQSIEDSQKMIEEAVWNQLYLRIELDFPASLENELLSDESKDAQQGMEFQVGDTTAGVGR